MLFLMKVFGIVIFIVLEATRRQAQQKLGEGVRDDRQLE